MIQLASDPAASRMNWRPLADDKAASTQQPRRTRTGHAWPFISQYADKPAPREQPTPTPSSERGS